MKIIGLTGGIAMGKSTAAAMLRFMGVHVHDSDATVHRLYDKGGAAVPLIANQFPGAVVNNCVDRAKLSKLVLGNPRALQSLESLIHPLVRAESHQWLRQHIRRRSSLVVLDIPLLFETNRTTEVDEIWVVNCPAFLQAHRAQQRPGMTTEKLNNILTRQMPQGQRLRKADRIFQTGQGKPALFRELEFALNQNMPTSKRINVKGY